MEIFYTMAFKRMVLIKKCAFNYEIKKENTKKEIN